MIFAHELSYHNFPLLIFPLKHLFCGSCGPRFARRTRRSDRPRFTRRTRRPNRPRFARRTARDRKGQDRVHVSRLGDGSGSSGLPRDRSADRDRGGPGRARRARRAGRTGRTGGARGAAKGTAEAAPTAAGARTIPADLATSVNHHNFLLKARLSARRSGGEKTALFHHIGKAARVVTVFAKDPRPRRRKTNKPFRAPPSPRRGKGARGTVFYEKINYLR